MSVISHQVRNIASGVCGRCGHLVEQITTLYEEEYRKLRDDLQRANKALSKFHGNDFECEPPDEGATEYEDNLHQIYFKTEIGEDDAIDIIDVKAEPNAEYSDAEVAEDSYEGTDNQTADVNKPFQCVERNCSRRYVRQTALTNHIRRVHGGSPAELKRQNDISARAEMPSLPGNLQHITFECIICKSAFKNERKLREHLRLSSAEQYLINLNKPRRDDNHVDFGTHFCHEKSCGLSFDSSDQLVKHLREHRPPALKRSPVESTDRKFSCLPNGKFACQESGCSREYANRSSLFNHFRAFHEGTYKCEHPDCGKPFPSPGQLRAHTKTHVAMTDRVRPFACTKCDSTFEWAVTLKRHLEKHNRYICSICDTSFAASYLLKKHKLLHGPDDTPDHDKEQFSCDVPNCGKSYQNLSGLKQHMILHASETPFSCKLPDCNEKFPSKWRLKEHKVLVHNMKYPEPEKEIFKCPECEIIVTKKSTLKYHIKRVHLKEKPHSCEKPDCGKSFLLLSELTRHRLYGHNADLSFLCAECGKGYNNQYLLKTHMNVHAGVKSFACDYPGCGKTFFTGSGQHLHKSTHEPGRRISCTWPDCKTTSGSAGDMRKHMRIHTGEKPFFCHYEGCGMSFNASTTRKRHITVIHLNQRPFQCDFPSCERAFASRNHLKAHLRTHNK